MRCREAVALVRLKHAYSERRVCRALGIARSVVSMSRSRESMRRRCLSRSLRSLQRKGATSIGK